jgi:hypothetical protein
MKINKRIFTKNGYSSEMAIKIKDYLKDKDSLINAFNETCLSIIKNKKKTGAMAIANYIRFNRYFLYGKNDYKVNNSIVPALAMLFESTFKEYKGFFSYRKKKGIKNL